MVTGTADALEGIMLAAIVEGDNNATADICVFVWFGSVGLYSGSSAELQRQLTEQFNTVPHLAGSREVKREFTYQDHKFRLRVIFTISEYPFRDEAYVRSWGDGVWKYYLTNHERNAHLYTKDQWLLTIRPGPDKQQVQFLLSPDS